MAAEKLGRARAGSGKEYEVFWDPSSREVYVGWAGRSGIGKATSAGHAMRMAEAWLVRK
ncbi:MAG: hypothetical protein KC549_02755 [Myxococcales bacterium]|nr:hypothetical protein [Myxococcales bacterium]MCB9547347.1 hypothetical protein [Myxococcales bacterium]